ncbi:DMT family transporter [Rhodoferax aquaticus]|uniref:DMT family transporter n=1 Tax=Rhodoferax aquaticus TaxID=2527691 RepID=A0A515EQ08_9BURK|nr:DMT family transporter [Rhodoferax aquaticus]QDL54710.1 DMT family transporter [Rhodoferax aquaticus]
MALLKSGAGSPVVAYVQLGLAMAIVGSSVVAGKLVAASMPVMLASAMRFAIAAPILIAMLLWREGRITWPNRADCLTLFLQALTGVFLFSVFLLFGLKTSGALEAGLITGTLPAVTAVMAVVLLRERPHRWQWLGIGFAVLGAALLHVHEATHVTGGQRGGGGAAANAQGMVLVLGAVVCEGLFVVLGKRTHGRVSALTIATAMSVLGFLMFLPFAAVEAMHFPLASLRWQDVAAVLYFGVVVSVGAFWLFYAGLSQTSAATAGAFMAFLPLSAVVLSAVVLGETLTPKHLAAGAFVLLGIGCAAWPKNQSTAARTEGRRLA